MVAENAHSELGVLLDFLPVFSAHQVSPDTDAAQQSPVGSAPMLAVGRTSSQQLHPTT